MRFLVLLYEDERAWEEALRRARGEFAEEDTDVVGKNQPSEPSIPRIRSARVRGRVEIR